MPIKYKDWSRRFKWQTAETGEPIGLLRDIGGALWLAVCPLCGCAHQHGAWLPGQVVKPSCMGKDAWHWANWRRDWLIKHPEAKDHKAVMLQPLVEPIGEMLTNAKISDDREGEAA